MSAPTPTGIPAEAETRITAIDLLLRLIMTGSVDDDRSALVDRLLFDSKSALRDQPAAVE